MTVLVHLSDLHFGDAAPTLVAGAISAVDQIAPDALVVTGDLTQKGRRREFEAARAFLDRFPVPKIIAPGNHDTPLFGLVARTVAPFARFEKAMDATIGSGLALHHLHARTLNTARGVQARMDWSLGSANLNEVERVASELESAPTAACRVVACHHPLITPANAPFPARTRRGRRAARRFAEAGVDLILSGHMHVAFAEALPFQDQRTYAIGASTAFSSRTRGVSPGFNVIRITGADVHVAPHTWVSDRFVEGDARSLPRRDRGNQAAA